MTNNVGGSEWVSSKSIRIGNTRYDHIYECTLFDGITRDLNEDRSWEY